MEKNFRHHREMISLVKELMLTVSVLGVLSPSLARTCW
jgi:hypothetical protein